MHCKHGDTTIGRSEDFLHAFGARLALAKRVCLSLPPLRDTYANGELVIRELFGEPILLKIHAQNIHVRRTHSSEYVESRRKVNLTSPHWCRNSTYWNACKSLTVKSHSLFSRPLA
jgi:hypothetical protein